MIEIYGNPAVCVHGIDIASAFVSESGYNTPAALAITRETGRACYINRMGYVCDLWICFAVVSPRVYRLMKQWEGGLSLRPFTFNFYLVKEFDAYPGGAIAKVEQHPNKSLLVYAPHRNKPFCMRQPVLTNANSKLQEAGI